ncbi:nuclear transport factor 2 family protein [Bacillus piscicola]|uniref:nuclear transport factor 2 family protein n=1 Tax=Bacillus piscicola TaxID=1632684 RepID=UPI001F098124|nr:nuclear transport factor 2 family protein [Bacillus piscicola]
MVTESQMKAAMQQYIDGFNQKDANMLISLFADHARIEDPVGGGKIVEGKAAITSFYELAVTLVDNLELSAPIRGSHSHYAAMAFRIFMKNDGKPIQIDTIDVMTFDDDGRIIDMKAYHGPGDVTEQ